MDNRLRKEQFKASREAQAQGLASKEHHTFVNQKLTEYKKVELIRRAVKDVKIRGEELDKKRKMQGKAYEGVKSKIARNIKVVDRVNREHGYVSPYKHRRPVTTSTTPQKIPNVFVNDMKWQEAWERNCTNYRDRSASREQLSQTMTSGGR